MRFEAGRWNDASTPQSAPFVEPAGNCVSKSPPTIPLMVGFDECAVDRAAPTPRTTTSATTAPRRSLVFIGTSLLPLHLGAGPDVVRSVTISLPSRRRKATRYADASRVGVRLPQFGVDGIRIVVIAARPPQLPACGSDHSGIPSCFTPTPPRKACHEEPPAESVCP